VQALQAMKQIAPDIKAIMMTAFTRDELVAEAWRATAVAIVSKPLELDHVLGLIDSVSHGDPPGI